MSALPKLFSKKLNIYIIFKLIYNPKNVFCKFPYPCLYTFYKTTLSKVSMKIVVFAFFVSESCEIEVGDRWLQEYCVTTKKLGYAING